MNAALIVLTVQVALGGLDNLLHHELTEALPSRVSARLELALHAVREILYAVVFLTLAWLRPEGVFAALFALILITEIAVTLWDFIEEDQTRRLPPFERVLHTVLALGYGVFLALFAPLLFAWAQEPSALSVETRGLWTPAFTVFAIGVFAWGLRDGLASWRLFRKAKTQSAAGDRVKPPSGRTVLVTGGTGFIGEAFVRRRLANGDRVIVLTRDPLKARAQFEGRIEAVSDLDDIPSFTPISAMINLAGANVAALPWTEARKKTLLESRLTTTRALLDLAWRLDLRPEALISASAVGYYGDRGEESLDETSAAQPGAFTSDLCAAWESEVARASTLRMRECRLRFGLVFGRDGGPWPRLTMTSRLHVAPVFGDGAQWTPWIHKDDALEVLDAALTDARYAGPINAVAPEPARQADILSAALNAHGGGVCVHAPEALVRAGLGEMSAIFLDSQRVEAHAAQRLGFRYRFETIEAAAADLLRPDRLRRTATTLPGKPPKMGDARS